MWKLKDYVKRTHKLNTAVQLQAFMEEKVGGWQTFVGLGIVSELMVLSALLLFFKRRGWF